MSSSNPHRRPAAARTGSENGGGSPQVDSTYNKRKKVKRRLSTPSWCLPLSSRLSVAAGQDNFRFVSLGVCLVLGSLLAVWRYSVYLSEAKAHRQVLEHLALAESRWKERHFDAPHADNNYRPERRLEWAFSKERENSKQSGEKSLVRKVLHEWLDDIDRDVIHNVKYGGPRWIRPYLLPPLPGNPDQKQPRGRRTRPGDNDKASDFFNVKRKETKMAWRDEWEALTPEEQQKGPPVDYTPHDKYHYPELMLEPPQEQGSYPPLVSLEELIFHWNQDEDNEGIISETLIHFNYSIPAHLEAAKRFRDAELPFKLVGVPEIVQAGEKWTDSYLSRNFATKGKFGTRRDTKQPVPLASGVAQESPSNYFAFFVSNLWDVDNMGLPPTRNTDLNFAEWAEHARYADATALQPDQPHMYWQSGVPAEERVLPKDKWTFISRDLPSMSSPTENFFVFHPEEQKGIQCRFGERGVVAATHFDGGRNMVAMISGAKRYILSPPNQCSKLGIFTKKKNPIYRHSLLDFGHIRYLNQEDHVKNSQNRHHAHEEVGDDDGMSPEERAWLERAATAKALETVLKAGEVLYIPSHWFHYIISLQKSAQCNVRSGIDKVGNSAFGGISDVEQCSD